MVNLPHRIEQPQLHQFTAKRSGIGEKDAMHTQGTRSLYIRWQVVDVDGMSRIDAMALKEQLKDTRVGFDQAHFAGKQDSFEPSQELESLERCRESFGRPVAQGIQRNSASVQFPEDVYGASDRTRHHLFMTLNPGVDQLGMGGLLQLECGRPRQSCVRHLVGRSTTACTLWPENVPWRRRLHGRACDIGNVGSSQSARRRDRTLPQSDGACE
jgi:hypothetical protein